MIQLKPDVGIGVGVGDLQLATQREVRRLLKEAKGSPDKALILALKKLVEMQLITEEELKKLTKLFEIGFRAAKGRRSAEEAYLQCREISDEMVASGRSSPVSLVVALAETNSYVSIDDASGTPTVVYKKSGEGWQPFLTGGGAIIGGALGGPVGAAIGGFVGGALGKAIDECKKD